MNGRMQYEAFVREMLDTFQRKNAGYAPNDDPWSNFRLAELAGVTPFQGVLVRMSDKFIRVMNLSRDPSRERVGESVMDTLADLAVYAQIARCIYLEEIEKEATMADKTTPTIPYEARLSSIDEDWRSVLQIIVDGIIIDERYDRGEPEDNTFGRDWAWVPAALEDAFKRGAEYGQRLINIQTNAG
jgi:hypothetical protein